MNSPKLAWIVTTEDKGLPYIVYKEPNRYTYGYKYTSVIPIVYFEFDDENP